MNHKYDLAVTDNANSASLCRLVISQRPSVAAPLQQAIYIILPISRQSYTCTFVHPSCKSVTCRVYHGPSVATETAECNIALYQLLLIKHRCHNWLNWRIDDLLRGKRSEAGTRCRITGRWRIYCLISAVAMAEH